MRRMTSSSAGLRRFFFFRPGCSLVAAHEAPLLLLPPVRRPLEWAASSLPFWAAMAEEEEEEEGEPGSAVPVAAAPLACMFPVTSPASALASSEALSFFRGGGDARPVSESEEAEARLSSPRAAVVEEVGGRGAVPLPGRRTRSGGAGREGGHRTLRPEELSVAAAASSPLSCGTNGV